MIGFNFSQQATQCPLCRHDYTVTAISLLRNNTNKMPCCNCGRDLRWSNVKESLEVDWDDPRRATGRIVSGGWLLDENGRVIGVYNTENITKVTGSLTIHIGKKPKPKLEDYRDWNPDRWNRLYEDLMGDEDED